MFILSKTNNFKYLVVICRRKKEKLPSAHASDLFLSLADLSRIAGPHIPKIVLVLNKSLDWHEQSRVATNSEYGLNTEYICF